MDMWQAMGSPKEQECKLGTLYVMASWNEKQLEWQLSYNVYEYLPESGRYSAVISTVVATLPATQEELLEMFMSELRKQIA
jgi:hypothetical protein